MKFQAIGERLIVRRHKSDETTKSGIIIPESAQEPNRMGVVMSVGDEAKGVKVEDTVVFGKFSGTEVLLGGESVLILHITDVLCISRE